MPDLMGYSVTRLANASLSVPRWQINGQIVDSTNQATVIQDFSATPLIFPTILGNLTTARQNAWVEEVVRDLIFRRYGIT